LKSPQGLGGKKDGVIGSGQLIQKGHVQGQNVQSQKGGKSKKQLMQDEENARKVRELEAWEKEQREKNSTLKIMNVSLILIVKLIYNISYTTVLICNLSYLIVYREFCQYISFNISIKNSEFCRYVSLNNKRILNCR
jgi:hypothetical protein